MASFRGSSPRYSSGGNRYNRYNNNNNNNNSENFNSSTMSPRRGSMNGSVISNGPKSAQSQNPTTSFMYGDYNGNGMDGTNGVGNGNGMNTPGGGPNNTGGVLDTRYSNSAQMLGGIDIRTPGYNDSGRRYGRNDNNNNINNSGLRQRKTPFSSQRHTSGKKQRSKTPGRGTTPRHGPPKESLSEHKFKNRGRYSAGPNSGRKPTAHILHDSTNDVNSRLLNKTPMSGSRFNNNGIGNRRMYEDEDHEWIKRWITIFGFDPAVTTYVKSYFENFGDIVEHKVGESNTIHVQYATVKEAERTTNVFDRTFIDDLKQLGLTQNQIVKLQQRHQEVKIYNIPIPDRPGIFVGVSSTKRMLEDGMIGNDSIPKRVLKDGNSRSKVQSPGSRLIRSNSEIHQGSQPAILDSASIMEEPRREYNCVQKIFRFLFLGTS